MTISSMTGFGRGEGSSGPWRFHWEVRSVNGKALDVRLRLPSGLEAIEQPVRASAAKHLKRGNVQVFLTLEKEESTAAIRVNEDALKAAIEAANQVSEAVGGEPVTADAVLQMRGVIEHAVAEEDEKAVKARDEALVKVANDAFAALAADRAAEGARLAAAISGQLGMIEGLTKQAIDNPSRTPDAIKQKLQGNIERILEASSSLDPDRLHAEAMIAAAKADIQEELDRLEAHVASARELLASDEPVGRKFDFLAQEFNREANTLCSKSTDTSLTRIGLDMKTTIDQLREQVQNIE